MPYQPIDYTYLQGVIGRGEHETIYLSKDGTKIDATGYVEDTGGYDEGRVTFGNGQFQLAGANGPENYPFAFILKKGGRRKSKRSRKHRKSRRAKKTRRHRR